jgi:hypothetical protein
LNLIIAKDSIKYIHVNLALGLDIVFPVRGSPGASSKAGQTTVSIVENISEGELVSDLGGNSRVEVDVRECGSSCSGVSCSRMETMRAWSEGSLAWLIKVVEFNVVHFEVFGSSCDDTMEGVAHGVRVCIGWVTDNQGSVDLSSTVSSVPSQRELNTTNQIISNFGVYNSYISYFF